MNKMLIFCERPRRSSHHSSHSSRSQLTSQLTYIQILGGAVVRGCTGTEWMGRKEMDDMVNIGNEKKLKKLLTKSQKCDIINGV